MGDDAYANVNLGKLRLKGKSLPVVGDKKKKKKKRRRTEDEEALLKKILQEEMGLGQEETSEVTTPADLEATMTEAERKFAEVQREREKKKIAQLASKSHREKIDQFNKDLDGLSQHFDIPKVGPG